MSDRISIAELREKMKPRPKWKGGEFPAALFMSAQATANLVLALVEAIEMARKAESEFGHEVLVRVGEQRHEELREWLDARFDFGDEA